MKENKYDEQSFFEKYSQMDRSKSGLASAGEWGELQKLLPEFEGKRVLDLGCGYGWHAKYAADNGAASVLGIDISKKMLSVAQRINAAENITYLNKALEDFDSEPGSFDVIVSSLAIHYIKDYGALIKKIAEWAAKDAYFVFSVEHPVFTSYGNQQFVCDESGRALYFPVDNYFYEGKREALFLGEKVTKYHRTLTTYLNGLLSNGFTVLHVVEPCPTEEMLKNPIMKDEMRRPMMLLVSCVKH